MWEEEEEEEEDEERFESTRGYAFFFLKVTGTEKNKKTQHQGKPVWGVKLAAGGRGESFSCFP
jgi:hypothetical protein